MQRALLINAETCSWSEIRQVVWKYQPHCSKRKTWKRCVLAMLLLCAIFLVMPPLVVAAPYERGHWTLLAPLLTPRREHTATVLPDGQVLVLGGKGADPTGHSLATVERYEPTTNRWSMTAPLQTPRAGQTATLLRDGRVLGVGGYDLSTAYASAELYEPLTATWTPAGNLAEARSGQTATVLSDGRVLVVGGHEGGQIVQNTRASAEIYDPATKRWSVAGTLSNARTYHTATLLTDGQVLVVGGLSDRQGPPLATVELYDLATNRWQQGAALPQGGYFGGLVTLPGVALAFGATGTGRASLLYDAQTNRWQTTGQMQADHTHVVGLALPNGQIAALGGGAPELYDPALQRWSLLPELNFPRGEPAAVVWPTGQLLVIGGTTPLGAESGAVLTGAVERYDPVSAIPGLPQTGGGGRGSTQALLTIVLVACIACAGAAVAAGAHRRHRTRTRG